MYLRRWSARIALALSLSLMAAQPAQAQFWQCAPFARMISGIKIFGNAGTWWAQAAGKFARGAVPKAGSVMSFMPTQKMRIGHVAMVSKVLGAREVLLTHANWSNRGRVETNVRAIDVSVAGDWSRVRVWYAGNGDLGTSTYPVNGFIYADGAEPAQARPLPGVTIAAASPMPVAPNVQARAAAFTLDLE